MEKILKRLREDETLTDEEFGVWIPIIQHERLVHLLVTLFFALICILFVFAAVVTDEVLFLVLFAICMVLDIFYIRHYYVLENGIQELYHRMIKGYEDQA